jgi:hypothetical protein
MVLSLCCHLDSHEQPQNGHLLCKCCSQHLPEVLNSYEKDSNGGDMKIVLLSLYVFLVSLLSYSLFFCLNWIIKGLEFIEWCSRLK